MNPSKKLAKPRRELLDEMMSPTMRASELEKDPTVLLVGSRSRYAPEVAAIVFETLGVNGVLVDNHSENFVVEPGLWAKYLRTVTTEPTYYFCAFVPGIRFKMLGQLMKLPISAGPAIVHPSASADRTAVLGSGTVANRLVAIGSGSVIGQHVHLNRGSLVGHDCSLSDFVSVGPGAILTGSVRAEKGVYIGAGATILPDILLGHNSTIGAGAVVTKNVPPFAVVVGNPARVMNAGEAGFRGFSVL